LVVGTLWRMVPAVRHLVDTDWRFHLFEQFQPTPT